MPTAPLAEDEKGTLLGWVLEARPETLSVAGKKKNIEHGLLHRLDTGTEGLVLVAKTQDSYENLYRSQSAGLIKKTYFAFCETAGSAAREGAPVLSGEKTPLCIQSRFRPFGPGRREVRPVFAGMKGFDSAKTDYETIIEKIEKADTFADSALFAITCTLVRGYRHQVRCHLASLGYPIIGDSLYNPGQTLYPDVPLQLYACGLSFPDPLSGVQVSFSLPSPDKMNP